MFFQAEDGIRDLVRSRGLGDVYKRQNPSSGFGKVPVSIPWGNESDWTAREFMITREFCTCLLYTSDAADERSSVDLGGRRIIKKKTILNIDDLRVISKEADTKLESPIDQTISYDRIAK